MNGLYLVILLAVTGCGSLQRLAMRSTTPVFEKSSADLLKEGNWDFFSKSTPGNLKFMELLWEQDKNNTRLLALLAKGYAGYAFAVHETLALEDEIKGVENSLHKKDAIFFYTRALDYGLLYLEKLGISRSDLLGPDEKLLKKLKDLDEEDAPALLYTAQSWGSLINLQKDNIALISQVPKVKNLFDRACKLQPEIDHNVCDIFSAQYEASRPKMLGGNPENAEKLYQTSIEKHPKNLLIRMSYIQHLLVPSMEKDKYEKVASALQQELTEWENINRDSLENNSLYEDVPELNLYNAITKKRFEIIEKYKAKIF